MQNATQFNFLGWKSDNSRTTFTFDYSIDFKKRETLYFNETIIMPTGVKSDSETLEKFLEPLSLALGISYYKLYCPQKITTAFPISKEQAEFWNTLYKKGLGEFCYRNNIDPKKIAKFPFKKGRISPVRVQTKNQALVGIGGGKDSIVASELLKEMPIIGNNDKLIPLSFVLETQKEDPIVQNVIELIGNPSFKIKRFLDPKIFEQHEGSYNGHIPISAIFAFTGLLGALTSGSKYVIVGNEYSSNFGNLSYKGETINHQWSKSAEFEKMFQEYTSKFITPDIKYFSLLRPFYEIRIAKMFSGYPKYFDSFTSCNRNFKVFHDRTKTLWCGECPKCAFVFLMLAPFVTKSKLVKMFGKNMLADETLVPLYGDLLGFGSMKPFDCVGAFEESQAGLYLASKSYKKDVVVEKFISKIKNGKELTEKVLSTNKASTLPTPFRLLGIESLGILGYRKEGKVSEQFIKKFYPKIKIGKLDEDLDKNYLKKQSDFDLIIKTPGIPKHLVTRPYTTATNLFFAFNTNKTIGITGTKGKSTTTTLVYEMLKAGGKSVRLLGNIGNPMLATLLEKTDPKEIFVIELSSYMLDDIEYSPNIALLLNLFPEHMNYHENVESYYGAKMNIFKFQKSDDIKILPPYTTKIPTKNIPLLGKHNETNIKAAISIARTFNVNDGAIKKAIENFKPLPHRLQNIGTFNGIIFYDDAISTTPQSAIAAIETLKKVDTLLLGGEDRGYDFRDLEKTIRKYKIKNLVLFPTSGHRMIKNKKGLSILETKSMQSAIKFAYKNTKKGSICLLSTASPSYSVWKNFEEKGSEFQKFVKTLGK